VVYKIKNFITIFYIQIVIAMIIYIIIGLSFSFSSEIRLMKRIKILPALLAIFILLTVGYLGNGCYNTETEKFPSHLANEQYGAISGFVTYNGDKKGHIYVLLMDKNNSPPPLGSGSPEVSEISANKEGRDRLFYFGKVKPGEYTISAFMDVDNDFYPLLTYRAGPSKGDIAGAYVNPVNGEALTVKVESNRHVNNIGVILARDIEFERPFFYLEESEVLSVLPKPEYKREAGVCNDLSLVCPYDDAAPGKGGCLFECQESQVGGCGDGVCYQDSCRKKCVTNTDCGGKFQCLEQSGIKYCGVGAKCSLDSQCSDDGTFICAVEKGICVESCKIKAPLVFKAVQVSVQDKIDKFEVFGEFSVSKAARKNGFPLLLLTKIATDKDGKLQTAKTGFVPEKKSYKVLVKTIDQDGKEVEVEKSINSVITACGSVAEPPQVSYEPARDQIAGGYLMRQCLILPDGMRPHPDTCKEAYSTPEKPGIFFCDILPAGNYSIWVINENSQTWTIPNLLAVDKQLAESFFKQSQSKLFIISE